MFIRVNSFRLRRDADGFPSASQECPNCGADMHINELRCRECGCEVAWGSDPAKDPEAEALARAEHAAAQRGRKEGETGIARAIRLLAIIRRLEAGERLKASELAKEYGCSQRSIERDFRDLQKHLGLPLVHEGWHWRLSARGQR